MQNEQNPENHSLSPSPAENRLPRSPRTGRSPCDEYLSTLKSNLPNLGRVFDQLDHGTPPNFLDFMAAISELVAFYTECDQNSGPDIEKIFAMSVKNCRFCS